MEPRSKQISDYKFKEDLRKQDTRFNNEFGEIKKQLFDSFVNIVVNHKKELQKIPACSTLNSANVWAQKRGLRAGEVDIDKDGQVETVVYNKAGQPFIINGYKLKGSDYAVRKAYWGAHPEPEDRAGEPMKEWVREQAYTDEPHPKFPWKRIVTTTKFGNELKSLGFRMPSKPKKQYSVFSHFCKLIAPIVKEYFEGGEIQRLLGTDASPNSSLLLKKLISPITIYRILYMKIVERWYMFHLRRGGINHNYASFKKHCKENKGNFWSFLMDNIVKIDNIHEFKENIVNLDVVSRLLVKDEINWDFSDPDDAIVFLMSKANVDDDEFTDIIQNHGEPGNADVFMENLKNGSKADKRAAAKLLEKWKNRASKGTKEFFENQVHYLMENDGAYNRYLAAVEAGKNPIDPVDPTDERAAPASPERSVEAGNASGNLPPEIQEEQQQGAEGFEPPNGEDMLE